jgi:hypothetical protein
VTVKPSIPSRDRRPYPGRAQVSLPGFPGVTTPSADPALMGGERRGAPTKARAAIRKLETVTRGCEAKSLNCLYWPQYLPQAILGWTVSRGCEAKSLNCLYWPQYLPQAILGWEGRVNGSRKQPSYSPIWNTGK